MPHQLYRCTPSRLTAWLDCPRRFRMAYVDRPPPVKGPPWAHNSLGVSIHNALRAWWDLPRGRRTSAGGVACLEAAWIEQGYRDDEQSGRWRVRGGQLVAAYVAGLDPDDVPVGLERTVGAATAAIALSGRIDRIDQRGGELVVVDYKTGRHLPEVDDARGSLALALYAVAAGRTLRRPCRRVELHHLPSGRIMVWEHTRDSLARQLQRAEAIAAEAAAAEARWRARLSVQGILPAEVDAVFPARPGPQCGWCDYVRHCPAGQSTGALRRSWEGLAMS